MSEMSHFTENSHAFITDLHQNLGDMLKMLIKQLLNEMEYIYSHAFT